MIGILHCPVVSFVECLWYILHCLIFVVRVSAQCNGAISMWCNNHLCVVVVRHLFFYKLSVTVVLLSSFYPVVLNNYSASQATGPMWQHWSLLLCCQPGITVCVYGYWANTLRGVPVYCSAFTVTQSLHLPPDGCSVWVDRSYSPYFTGSLIPVFATVSLGLPRPLSHPYSVSMSFCLHFFSRRILIFCVHFLSFFLVCLYARFV